MAPDCTKLKLNEKRVCEIFNILSNAIDESGNIKVSGTGGGETSGVIGLQNTEDIQINPATEDTLSTLAEYLMVLEPMIVKHSFNSEITGQEITLDEDDVFTSTEALRYIQVKNDSLQTSNDSLIITIGTYSFEIKAGEVFEEYFSIFDSFKLEGTAPYRIYLKGYSWEEAPTR